MRKRVNGNTYNHLEKHTPLMTRTSYGFKMTLKDSPCFTEWIGVSYKPLGCIFLIMCIRFFTACAIKKIDFGKLTHINTFLHVIRHWHKVHKTQNVVLQWLIDLKTCGKYKYWIISKLNKKRNSVLHLLLMWILYLFYYYYYYLIKEV